MFRHHVFTFAALASSLAAPCLAQSTDEATTVSTALYNFDKAVKPARPRILTNEPSVLAAARDSLRRLGNVKEIGAAVKRNPIPAAALTKFTAGDMTSWNEGIAGRVEQIAAAAFVHLATADSRLKADMEVVLQDRLRTLAPIIKGRDCSEDVYYAREYVFTLALAYDFAPSLFANDTDKKHLQDVVEACISKHFQRAITTAAASATGGIEYNAVSKFAAGLLLLRGDDALDVIGPMTKPTQSLLQEAVRTYIPRVPLFGTDDGGYINGSSYFLWEAGESVLQWDVFQRVLKYPMYAKPWVSNLPQYFAWTLPPGSALGVFGDGAEVVRSEEWGRLGRAVMNRYTTTESKWWVSFLNKHCKPGGLVQCGDLNRLNYVLSPAPPVGTAEPAPGKLSKEFRTSGLASFHSDFNALDRLSIHFKSSPLGAPNHGHADQNTFTIFHQGKALTTDGGVYGDYGASHRLTYSKQSVAHNVITYNDRQGQSAGAGAWGDPNSDGAIVAFNQASPAAEAVLQSNGTLMTTRGTSYNTVVGDATLAYAASNANITKALRTMIFVRPSTLVVIDQMESKVPQQWENNLHFPVSAVEHVNGQGKEWKVSVPNGAMASTMCVNVRGAVDLVRQEVNPYTDKQYPVPDSKNATNPDYWNMFSYPAAQASTKGLFVSVFRIGCTDTLAVQNIGRYANGMSVNAGLFDVTIPYTGPITVK